MNSQMNTAIKAALSYLQTFEQSMKIAAMDNDAMIDKNEEKILKKLRKATERYARELEDLIED